MTAPTPNPREPLEARVRALAAKWTADPAPQGTLWRSVAVSDLLALLDEPEAASEAWPFGAESAAYLIAATGNPNERKENRESWAVRLINEPDILAIEADRARTRLEQAIALLVTPPTAHGVES